MKLDIILERKDYKKKKIRFNKVIIKYYNYYKKRYYIKEQKSLKKE